MINGPAFWKKFRKKFFKQGQRPAASNLWPGGRRWQPESRFGRAQAVSLLLHTALVVALAIPATRQLMVDVREPIPPVFYYPPNKSTPPPTEGKQARGGGSGGGGEAEAPTGGRVPPFAWIQIAPPTPKIKNLDPKLTADATVVGPPELRPPHSDLANLGNPIETLVNFSAGPGGDTGIGRGKNGSGIGDGDGGVGAGPGGPWGTGGGKSGIGNRIVATLPRCKYCPDPKYTDEARKVKYQGTVWLRAVITPQGKATNITVVRGVGMGLDKRAKEAVADWEFLPAIAPGGQPVAYEVTIEITFRLL